MGRRATIDQALAEAYATAKTDSIVYETLEIYEASMAEPIRVVRGWDTIQATLEADAPRDASTAVVFLPLGFELTLPSLREGEMPYLEVKIYDASTLVVPAIEAAAEAATPSPIQVIYRPFLDSDLSKPMLSPVLTMSVESIHVDEQVVSAKASFLNYLNKPVPRRNYTRKEWPGLAAA